MLDEPRQEKITLNSMTVTKIKMPVTTNNGNIFLPEDIKISNAVIPSGIYTASKGHIEVLAENPGEEVSFIWTKPATTFPLSDFIECNQSSCFNVSQYDNMP
ncbi:hypothetical protein, partial [Acinetobacter baumannii]|uniref:hypothetical protein n=1 Tax=Acinetobacter baumannii TaxID=470 RepID=UPI00197AB324